MDPVGNNVFDGRYVDSSSLLTTVRRHTCMYDVIAEDAVQFFRRCASAMRPQGVIFLKENVCDNGFIVDSDDCSITRSHGYFIELFKRAGVRIAHSALQKNFPKQLFKVRMYALRFD